MMTFADLAVGDTFTVLATDVVYVKLSTATIGGLPGAAEPLQRHGDPVPPDVYGPARYVQMFRADALVERR